MEAGYQYQVVISDRCINCGMCAEYCGFGVLTIAENAVYVQEGCNGCGACAEICPEQAIRIIRNDPPAAAGLKGQDPLPLEKVKEFVLQVLRRSHVPEAEAAIVAESLLEADLRGIESHGLARLPGYLTRIKLGLMLPYTDFKVEKQQGAVSVCDAGNGWGQVAGLRAMELCIANAKKYGVGIATIKRSNHFGVASFYTLSASRAGCIGIAMGNTGPTMAAWGGRVPVLGTNPVSVAAPSPRGEFCVDMALTTVAKSKIRFAAQEGREIPPTWALDAEGRPTTDPVSALKGTLQPAGAAKGYAAALVVDLLSGVLSGGAYSTGVRSSFDLGGVANVSQFVAAIDPGFFLSLEELQERMSDWTEKVKAGQAGVRLPGDRSAALRAENAVAGLRIGPKTRQELAVMAAELGITAPWE